MMQDRLMLDSLVLFVDDVKRATCDDWSSRSHFHHYFGIVYYYYCY